MRAKLGELERMPERAAPDPLPGAPAMAALEDVRGLAGWARRQAWRPAGSGRQRRRGRHRLQRGLLAPRLGLDGPNRAGILSYSGGFAWPVLFAPGAIRSCIAQPFRHPPIASIRRMAEADRTSS